VPPRLRAQVHDGRLLKIHRCEHIVSAGRAIRHPDTQLGLASFHLYYLASPDLARMTALQFPTLFVLSQVDIAWNSTSLARFRFHRCCAAGVSRSRNPLWLPAPLVFVVALKLCDDALIADPGPVSLGVKPTSPPANDSTSLLAWNRQRRISSGQRHRLTREEREVARGPTIGRDLACSVRVPLSRWVRVSPVDGC
jgi:hypothetical protein